MSTRVPVQALGTALANRLGRTCLGGRPGGQPDRLDHL